MTGKTVFATVGTTKFDRLVQTLTQSDVLDALKAKGYDSLVIQRGNGSFVPNVESAANSNIRLDQYTYKPSIRDDILRSDLVISHAGAGTCLEVLAAGKDLLVVVNDDLMHNHQTELAERLSRDGHLVSCYCDTLKTTIEDMDVTNLKRLPDVDPNKFSNYLDSLMGF